MPDRRIDPSALIFSAFPIELSVLELTDVLGAITVRNGALPIDQAVPEFTDIVPGTPVAWVDGVWHSPNTARPSNTVVGSRTRRERSLNRRFMIGLSPLVATLFATQPRNSITS